MFIEKVISGCSSCVEVIDFDSREILPGESARVTVALLTNYIEGQTRKAVLIKYGNWKPAILTLNLEAIVVPASNSNKIGRDKPLPR